MLIDNGVFTFIRMTRGDDESTACGQLVTKKKMKTRENLMDI